MAKSPAWLPPTRPEGPLDVSLIIGSFKYQPIHQPLLRLVLPPSAPAPTTPDAVRYGLQPEIQHTFRPESRIPMKVVSAVFALATLSPWILLLGLVRRPCPSPLLPFPFPLPLLSGIWTLTRLCYSGHASPIAPQSSSPTRSSHLSLYWPQSRR